jgi:hypothetical protein
MSAAASGGRQRPGAQTFWCPDFWAATVPELFSRHFPDGTTAAMEALIDSPTGRQKHMITLFLMGLLGAAVMLGAIPVVVFALMLETCAEREKVHGPRLAVVRSPALAAGATASFDAVAA